jgi:hypothetical protein
MKSIRARTTYIEPEIDLGKRTNRDGHGREIVSDLKTLCPRFAFFGRHWAPSGAYFLPSVASSVSSDPTVIVITFVQGV